MSSQNVGFRADCPRSPLAELLAEAAVDPSTVQHDIATLLVSRGISHTAAHQAATTIIDSIADYRRDRAYEREWGQAWHPCADRAWLQHVIRCAGALEACLARHRHLAPEPLAPDPTATVTAVLFDLKHRTVYREALRDLQ